MSDEPCKGHLPRLPCEYYRGAAFVHWTHTTQGRVTAWDSERVHAFTREVILHACHRFALVTPIYCLMPDHVHIVWLGLASDSDQRQATGFLRKNMAKIVAPALLQREPYDHVLREHERERGAFAKVVFYIAENPVRKGLCAAWQDYPYTGCIVPGYPEMDLRDDDHWTRFWRVYAYLRDGMSR